MASVVWNEGAFLAMYPQFAPTAANAPTAEQLSALWEMACTLIDNSEGSLIPYDPDNGVYIRKIALYALVCHLATMATWGANGQSGTITSASEGSVSASFQIPTLPGGGVTAQWYNQTPCGRTVWTLLRRLSLGGIYYGVNNFHPYG